MLTPKDLVDIGNLIDSKLDSKLESKFEEKLKPIKTSLTAIRRELRFVTRVLDRDHIKQVHRFDDHLSKLHSVSPKSI